MNSNQNAFFTPSHNLRLVLASAIMLLGLSGCASVKIVDSTVRLMEPINRPSQIYVQGFDTEGGQWNVDRTGVELDQFKLKTSTALRGMMVERFQVIAPTLEVPETLPTSGLLVGGEFVRVNQGSRALRMGIGFGAGATKIETRVRLYDLARSSTEPVATFFTTGGSNAQPGLIGGGPIAGTLQASANSLGLTTDLERTSREVRDFIRQRLQNPAGAR